MLRIARLTERTGRYYLTDLAVDVAAAKLATVELASGAVRGVEAGEARPVWPAPGRWVGAGSAGLGLSGTPDPGALEAVLAGRSPSSGRALRRHDTEVSGYDLTFAAPKSVSIAFGLCDPATAGTVEAAHAAAVEEAFGYMATRAASVRRGSGDARRVEPVEGLVGASFTHGVSRALDPHLHTHVVVANLAHGVDGRWTAIDGRGLYAHAAAAGALYDAQLRHELSTRLGLGWTERRSGAYELAVVDPAVIGAFAARRAEIADHLHGRTAPGPVGLAVPVGVSASRRARAVAWAATRDPKPSAPDPGALRRMWAGRAQRVGVTWGPLGHVLEAGSVPADGARSVRGRLTADVDEHRFAAALAQAPHRGPTRRHAIAAWAGALAGGAPARTVGSCVEMLAEWGPGTGVDERSVRPADLVPAPHLLRALGPRPSTPRDLATWQGAALSVDRYRARWSLDDLRQPLGSDGSPGALSRMPARRLAEHLAAERDLSEARRRLGRTRAREPQSPERSLGRG
jgi:conjugative relaxase-like TrwC/TraI family protein